MMPRRKDISSDLRELFGVHHSTERKITIKTAVNLTHDLIKFNELLSVSLRNDDGELLDIQ